MFELDLTRREYKSPLIRIGLSALVALIVCLFRVSITIENPVVNVIVSLLCIAIVVMSILCLFIASVECLQVGDNRRRDKMRRKDKYK
jgi:protein-S-isoprenylcysteine O-methyltransferase Ste14